MKRKKKNYKPAIMLATVVITCLSGMTYMTGMPKPGVAGGTQDNEELSFDMKREVERLRSDVVFQCKDIGRRSSRYSAQQKKFNEWMEYSLMGAGFDVTIEDYPAGNARGKNIIGIKRGTESGTILIGTHYDSYGKSPCANATGTAVATITATVRELAGLRTKKTVIAAFFGTGERPHRGRETAGAAVWLKKAQEEGIKIDMALLVGSFGVYIDTPDSQTSTIPWNLVTPDTADWVGIYGSLNGRETVTEVLEHWAAVTDLPARGFATPTWMPGIMVEDQVPFQEAGVPAVLFSDTGTQRWPSTRSKYDNPYELDYKEMARRVRVFVDITKRYAGVE